MYSSDEGKLFVGGLHWTTTTEGMKAYFEQYGQVVECMIMKDPTGKSRCFGFVTFSDPNVLDDILSKVHVLDKKQVKICPISVQIDPKRAVPKDQQQHQILAKRFASQSDETKIFIGGVHVSATEDEVREFFSQFDEVVEAMLMKDRETGRSRGFGFVTFASTKGVEGALSAGKLYIRSKPMEVKLAVPKSKVIAYSNLVELEQPSVSAPSTADYDYTSAFAAYGSNPTLLYEAMKSYYGNTYDESTIKQMTAYYVQYFASLSGASNANSNLQEQESSQDRNYDIDEVSNNERSGSRRVHHYDDTSRAPIRRDERELSPISGHRRSLRERNYDDHSRSHDPRKHRF